MNTQTKPVIIGTPDDLPNPDNQTVFEMRWWRGIWITRVTSGGRMNGTDFERRTDKPDFVIGAAGLDKRTYAFGGGLDDLGVTARRAVYINWQDFGVPDLNEAWWKSLYEAIKEIKPSHLHVQCVGGMGRTGTVLTILYALSMKGQKGAPKTVREAIDFIRAHGDPRSVETNSQRVYISAITGLPQ